MKTDRPRITNKIGNGRVVVYFPQGEKRLMHIEDYFFDLQRKGYY